MGLCVDLCTDLPEVVETFAIDMAPHTYCIRLFDFWYKLYICNSASLAILLYVSPWEPTAIVYM
jgi:hypothetical protein